MKSPETTLSRLEVLNHISYSVCHGKHYLLFLLCVYVIDYWPFADNSFVLFIILSRIKEMWFKLVIQ